MMERHQGGPSGSSGGERYSVGPRHATRMPRAGNSGLALTGTISERSPMQKALSFSLTAVDDCEGGGSRPHGGNSCSGRKPGV